MSDDLVIPAFVVDGWYARSRFWLAQQRPVYDLEPPDLTASIRVVKPTAVREVELTIGDFIDGGRVREQRIVAPGYVVITDPKPLLLVAFPLQDQPQLAPDPRRNR